MVGGKVINVVRVGGNSWIQVQDGYNDVCAVRVEGHPEVGIGDSIWWQSGFCYHTPIDWAEGDPYDIRLEKIGYSHGTIPDDVMETIGW